LSDRTGSIDKIRRERHAPRVFRFNQAECIRQEALVLFRLSLACVLVVASVKVAALAQVSEPYPSRPVRILVITPPGGTADLMARLIAGKLPDEIGGSFVVENRPGASGALASTTVAKSAPDGYVLLFSAINALAILPNLMKTLQYDAQKDLSPISLISYSPNLLLTHPSFPAKTVPELIELLKANPGKYDYGSGGVGSSQQLAMALLLFATGTRMNHVPFSGGSGQLTAALVGNTVGIGFDVMTTAMPHVRGGTLRPLGISSRGRSPSAPDIPAISEFVPGFEIVAWNAMLAPAGTPQPIIDKLSGAIGRILKSPEVTARLNELGTTPVGSSPAELADVIRSETKRFGEALASIGVTPQ
jgi:tripartite-type tricarboxylate transporter receptor subunit TctC